MKQAGRLITILIVIVLIVGGVWFWTRSASGLVPAKTSEAGKGYVAVFLANDQVYFGQLKEEGGVLDLTDVYYIRVNSDGTTASNSANSQAQLALVKLGDQIHGPVNDMRINKDHVLFVERLKDDSTVVRAIQQEKDSAANGNTQSNTPAANTTTPAANK